MRAVRTPLGISILLIAAGGACGGGAGNDNDGGATTACDESCVVGWWTTATGNCASYCSLDPQLPECAQADCEQLQVYSMEQAGSYSLGLAAHSPSSQSFTLLVINPDSAWSVPEPCQLRLSDQGDATTFECVESEIRFTVGVWKRPSPNMQSALEDAFDDVLPSSQTY